MKELMIVAALLVIGGVVAGLAASVETPHQRTPADARTPAEEEAITLRYEAWMDEVQRKRERGESIDYSGNPFLTPGETPQFRNASH